MNRGFVIEVLPCNSPPGTQRVWVVSRLELDEREAMVYIVWTDPPPSVGEYVWWNLTDLYYDSDRRQAKIVQATGWSADHGMT